MNKFVSSLLSLSTLAISTALPLNAQAMPVLRQDIKIFGRFNDRPYDNIDHYYALYCRKRDEYHQWQKFGEYRRQEWARRAEREYEDQGFRCFIARRY